MSYSGWAEAPWDMSRGTRIEPAVFRRKGQRRQRRFAEETIYTSMFEDDVSSILPYRSGNERWYRVLVAGGNEDLVRCALPSHYWPADTLEDALRDTVTECVLDLVHGPIYIEIEYFLDGEGNDLPNFRLHVVPSDFYRTRFGKVHVKPADHGIADKSRTHEIDPASLVRIELPRPERRAMKRALAAMKTASRYHLAPVDMLTSGNPPRGLDIKLHTKELARGLRAATNSIGWDGRGQLVEGMEDPYRVWRSLQFARYRLTLLDLVMRGLNRALDTAGGRLGFSASLEVEGLITLADIDVGLAAIDDGREDLPSVSLWAQRLSRGLRPT